MCLNVVIRQRNQRCVERNHQLYLIFLIFFFFLQLLVVILSEDAYSQETATQIDVALRDALKTQDCDAREQAWTQVLATQAKKCVDQALAVLDANARTKEETSAYIQALGHFTFDGNFRNVTEMIKTLNPQCPDDGNVTALVNNAQYWLKRECENYMSIASRSNGCKTTAERANSPAPDQSTKAIFDEALKGKTGMEIADEMEKVCMQKAGDCSTAGKGKLKIADDRKRQNYENTFDGIVGNNCKSPECLRNQVSIDATLAATLGALKVQDACSNIERWVESNKQNN